jgi:hypothetical protein
VVHRRLRPAVVLVEAGTHRVSVADFAIPGPLDEYAAPKRRGGELLDGRADVYSLGRLLARCLPDEDFAPVVETATADDDPEERLNTRSNSPERAGGHSRHDRPRRRSRSRCRTGGSHAIGGGCPAGSAAPRNAARSDPQRAAARDGRRGRKPTGRTRWRAPNPRYRPDGRRAAGRSAPGGSSSSVLADTDARSLGSPSSPAQRVKRLRRSPVVEQA